MFRGCWQRVVFTSHVFHPQVHAESGELDMKRKFPAWSGAPKHYLWHIVAYIRRIFYAVGVMLSCSLSTTEPSSSWNHHHGIITIVLLPFFCCFFLPD